MYGDIWDWREALRTAEPAHCPGWCDGGHDTEGAFGNLVTSDEVTHHTCVLAKVHDFEITLYLTEAHSAWKQEAVVDMSVLAGGCCLADSMTTTNLERLVSVPGIEEDLIEAVRLAKIRLAELSVEA